jgi:chromosomal replication initiator protein
MSFDPRLTFDTFVVGPANRLASAAARRAAESPGASYNPLFLYSASGLGKSHILNAIAHHARRSGPGGGNGAPVQVVYETLEGYLDTLTRALEAGGGGSGKEAYHEVDILLLDDVQFLTGQNQAQEMLLRTLDTLTGRGAQVVLASDRPPAEINGLDARLLSRFSGGLIVDIGLPDFETRVAIMRRKVEERRARLAEGVADVLGRFPFQNVRELQGSLNRLLAVQELEDRVVPLEELGQVLGEPVASWLKEGEGHGGGGRGSPGADSPSSPGGGERAPGSARGEVPEWRRALLHVVEAVEAAGYVAARVRRLLDTPSEPAGWRQALQDFRRDVDRLREIREEIEALPTPWPEDADVVLRDPDLLDEAERLLATSAERARPFPPLPPGPTLVGEGPRFPPLARRAAERAMTSDGGEYNPLFVHALSPARSRAFLAAAGRSYLELRPRGRVGLLSVPEFSEEFIDALSAGVAGAWRERWWSLDLLLVDRVEELGRTERAQEEFFHLFEALKRKGARVFLAADRPASALEGIDDRLRSRFQGGLVLDLGAEPAPVPQGGRHGDPLRRPEPWPGPARSGGGPEAPAGRVASPPHPSPEEAARARDEAARAILAELEAVAGEVSGSGAGGEAGGGAGAGAGREGRPEGVAVPAGAEDAQAWVPPRDRVVWRWHRIEDRIVEGGS